MAWVMTQSKAKGLKYWCDKLSHTQLPVLANNLNAMKKIPRTDGIPHSRLVIQTEKDPVLCWHVIRAANRRHTNPLTDIASLHLSISMIGQTRFWETVDKAPLLKPNPKSQFQMTYIRELSFSLLAADLARNWASQFQVSSPDAVYWNTLLARSPLWALWFVAYPEMLKWQSETRDHHQSRAKVDAELFGCSIEDICFGVAKLWKLPPNCYESWHRNALPSTKDLVSLSRDDFSQTLESKLSLRMLIQQPFFFSYLAHWAVMECRWSWYKPQLLRCLKVVAHVLHTPVGTIANAMHKTAVDVSRASYVAGLAVPAAHLLWTDKASWPTPAVYEPIYEFAKDSDEPNAGSSESKDSRMLQKAKVRSKSRPTDDITPRVKPTKSAAPQASVAIPEIDQVLLTKTIEQLSHHADTLSDIHHVFRLCMSGLREAIHYERGFACLLNPQQKTVRIGYSEGFSSTDPLRKLVVPLNQAPLFVHLLKHPSSMHIEATMLVKIKDKLPNEMFQKLKVNDFVLMSVFAGAKPIGIVYGDRFSPHHRLPIRPEDYDAFKKLCQAVCVGLDKVARHQRRRSQKA
jgi:hypothetical protein